MEPTGLHLPPPQPCCAPFEHTLLSLPPPRVAPQVREPSARVEHEASTSKIAADQLFYFQQRGIAMEDAVGMIISGFCREVGAGGGGCCCCGLASLWVVGKMRTPWA